MNTLVEAIHLSHEYFVVYPLELLWKYIYVNVYATMFSFCSVQIFGCASG